MQDLRAEDDTAFVERVRAQLGALETVRLAKLKVFKARRSIAIPAALVLTPLCGYLDWLLLLFQRGNDDSAAGITFAMLGGLYWWATQPRRQYAKAYKNDILPKLAEFLGGLTYRLDGKIPMAALEPSKIVPSHDKYQSEDYFEGEFKGVSLRFSEIKLTERTGSGKNRRTVTKFKGLCILLQMQKKRFFGHTVLSKDQSKLTEWFKEKTLKMDHADLVDPEFEKVFDVYTTDQMEARYLIDPVIIERLKGLYVEYEGEKMSAAWYDNQLLIMIASKHNHFEPASINVPATAPESVMNMKREVEQILSIIDRLDLYDPLEVRPLAG